MVLLWALPATAGDTCAPLHEGLPSGPLGLSFFEGDIGRPRRVCPHNEVAITGSLMAVDVSDDLIVEDGNFYATLAGAGEISGSWKFSERGELFASIEAVKYRYVQNATLINEHLGLGFLSTGATYQTWSRGSSILAITGRLTLPTAIGYYENAWPLALDFGLVLASRPMAKLSIHAQLGTVLSFAISHGDPGTQAGLQLLAGMEYTPWDWLGLVLDLGALLGYREGLDQMTLGVGFRFRIWEGLGLELASMLPVAGSTTSELAVVLRVSYRPRSD
jgi:hypothetical protein